MKIKTHSPDTDTRLLLALGRLKAPGQTQAFCSEGGRCSSGLGLQHNCDSCLLPLGSRCLLSCSWQNSPYVTSTAFQTVGHPLNLGIPSTSPWRHKLTLWPARHAKRRTQHSLCSGLARRFHYRITRKQSDKFRIWDILRDNWLGLCKSVRVIKEVGVCLRLKERKTLMQCMDESQLDFWFPQNSP